MIRVGIDLGGTKIEGVALDAQGQELWRQRVWTPQGDYAGTLDAIRDLVLAALLILDHRPELVVVTLDVHGLVKHGLSSTAENYGILYALAPFVGAFLAGQCYLQPCANG